MTKVAFIGLGVMGYPMAGHLAAGGHEVTVYNRTAGKAEAWVERELDKAKNQTIADTVRSMQTYDGIAGYLGYFETIGTVDDFFAYQKRLKAATVEDVQRVAREYLRPEGQNVLVIRRKK